MRRKMSAAGGGSRVCVSQKVSKGEQGVDNKLEFKDDYILYSLKNNVLFSFYFSYPHQPNYTILPSPPLFHPSKTWEKTTFAFLTSAKIVFFATLSKITGEIGREQV